MRPPPLLQSAQLRQTLNSSILVRYILLFVCGWITVIVIDYFYGTIALFTAAGIFAALLNYPVVWLSRFMPRGLAIALSFIAAIALLLGLVAIIGLQVLNQGQGLLLQIGDALNQQPLPIQNLLNQFDISNAVGTLKTSLATGLGLVKSLFSSVFIGVFGAVISLYMLIDGGKLWQLFLNRIPAASRDRFARIFQQSFLGFIRGQLLLMLFLSSTTLLIFPFLGVNYALILATIIGIIDAIPGIGATLGVIVVTFLVFTAQGSAIAIKVFIACIILIQIQDNVIRPKVMGDALELNPVLLFLALFIGERVAGLLGIFLSIPFTLKGELLCNAGMITLWMQPDSRSSSKKAPEIVVALKEQSSVKRYLCGLIVVVFLSACTSSQSAPQAPAAQLKTVNLDNTVKIVAGQTVYVPIYSHIYTVEKNRTIDLTATLSVRNTDLTRAMIVSSVNYYDTNGKLVRQYLEQPVELGALAATNFVIAQEDASGGAGAAFVVEWVAQNQISAPVIEAVMINTGGNQGLSFVSPGRIIKSRQAGQ